MQFIKKNSVFQRILYFCEKENLIFYLKLTEVSDFLNR